MRYLKAVLDWLTEYPPESDEAEVRALVIAAACALVGVACAWLWVWIEL